jgi:hypothetical protein
MRFRNLLGLLAIGGAVAYARKKRGADLSLDGIKRSVKNTIDNVRNRLEDKDAADAEHWTDAKGTTAGAYSRRNAAGTSDLDSSARSSVADPYSETSGYSRGGTVDTNNGTRRR